MHLIYLDESGNSGNNLNDAEQPCFVLCAMIVAEAQWLNLEQGLQGVIEKHFPSPRPQEFEIHGSHLRSGREFFHGKSVAERVAFRDAWMDEAPKHDVK